MKKKKTSNYFFEYFQIFIGIVLTSLGLKAFLLPFAPVDFPPWNLHLPFAIAGCRHGLPVLREYAPHFKTFLKGLQTWG